MWVIALFRSGCPPGRPLPRLVSPSARPSPNSAPSPHAMSAAVNGTEIRLADQSAERRQGRLRSRRRLGDEVDGAADQRPSGEARASAARPQAAAVSATTAKPAAAARRGQPAVRMRRRQAVAKPRRGADDEPSRPPPVATSSPNSAARLHRPSHCDDDPASAAAKRAPRQAARASAAIARPTPPPTVRRRRRRRRRRHSTPPITASTGTTARGAALPGAAASIRPPTAPATTPARPPPIDAARPSRRGECGGAAQPEQDELAGASDRAGPAENRHRPRLGDVPSRVPQQRARERVMRTGAEPPQRLGRAERVQELGGLALLVFVAARCAGRGEALQQRFVRIRRPAQPAAASGPAGRLVRDCHSPSSSSSTTSGNTNR